MATIESKRKRIIKRVEKISEPDLNRVLNFVENLSEWEKRRKEILSYAGSWADMPSDFMKDLTTNLHKRRKDRRDISR
jgi:hypothetical protein